MALVNPEFIQTLTYTAMRDRLALEHGGAVQAGAWSLSDLTVTQRGAGANMSVDVATGYALVPANDAGNKGMYHVENNGTTNVTVGASHGTNPRIDQIILRVNDQTDGGDANNTPSLSTLAGTATAGATLDNRTGAASLPTGSIRLADVLVPAGSSSVTTGNIRDRRQLVRGVLASSVNSAISWNSDVTPAWRADTSIDPIVVEIGGPVIVSLVGQGVVGGVGGAGSWPMGQMRVGYTAPGGSFTALQEQRGRVYQSNEDFAISMRVVANLAAGRYSFSAQTYNTAGTWGAAFQPGTMLSVVEPVKPVTVF